jgi:hypothetical protein
MRVLCQKPNERELWVSITLRLKWVTSRKRCRSTHGCPHGAAAIRRAQALASDKAHAGAVAFSRSGDPNLGEFEDAVILKKLRRGPE